MKQCYPYDRVVTATLYCVEFSEALGKTLRKSTSERKYYLCSHVGGISTSLSEEQSSSLHSIEEEWKGKVNATMFLLSPFSSLRPSKHSNYSDQSNFSRNLRTHFQRLLVSQVCWIQSSWPKTIPSIRGDSRIKIE